MTGQRVARSNIQHVDAVFFFPFDFAFIVNRTLKLVKPRLFIMMETEIWPNLLRACRRQGVRTLLVNGRISSRSYPRYRLARGFFRRVLDDVDRFCMQSEESARRIIEIGADPARVSVSGSLKFDSLELPTAQSLGRGPARVLRFFRIPETRPVVIAATTLKGEDDAVLAAFRRVKRTAPDALLIIAPRKPERFADVETLARQEGFRVVRRTELRIDDEPRADVVVLDTIGELARLFQVGTVVFVGGSLVDAGGHNILEPAVFGKPILFGPHMQNFAEIARAFLEHQAARAGRLGARARGHARGAAGRPGAPGEPRRRRARPRRGQPRRQGQEPGRHCRAAAARRALGRRHAVPAGPVRQRLGGSRQRAGRAVRGQGAGIRKSILSRWLRDRVVGST